MKRRVFALPAPRSANARRQKAGAGATWQGGVSRIDLNRGWAAVERKYAPDAEVVVIG
jgi:hypothetical protein